MARLTRKDVPKAVIIPLTHKIPDDFLIGDNCGIYGWNWSAYRIDGRYVIQGYRSFPKDVENMPKAFVDELEAVRQRYSDGGYKDYDEFINTYRNRFDILYGLTIH